MKVSIKLAIAALMLYSGALVASNADADIKNLQMKAMPLYVGNLPNIVQFRAYSIHEGHKFYPRNITDLSKWLSGDNRDMNLHAMEAFKKKPLLTLSPTAYGIPESDYQLACFSYIFFPADIKLPGPQEGFEFRLQRIALPGEVLAAPPTALEKEIRINIFRKAS